MAQKSENGAKVTPLNITEVKPGWSGNDDRYAKSLVNHLTLGLAKDMYSATAKDKFNAVILSVRTAMIRDWISTQQQYYLTDAKRVYYLSMEFLLGRLLNSYLINLGLTEQYRQALGVLDIEFEEVLDNEWDAALGQRRPGQARRLLPRLDGDAAVSLLRIRHPLRIRYIQPEDQGRLPVGSAR